MDGKVIEMITDRFDRLEDKVDSLVEFKHTWLGRIGALAAIGTIGGSLFVAFVAKKLGWG
jgi:hypothetical protein